MYTSIVDAWQARVAAGPDRAAIRYFDGTIDAATLDAHSDALAAELQARGVRPDDRIGIFVPCSSDKAGAVRSLLTEAGSEEVTVHAA